MSYDQSEYHVSLTPVYGYDFVAAVEEFVHCYYLTLESAPHDAWRRYTVGGQYMHVDGEATDEGSSFRPAVGHHQIHSNVVYQRFFECRFRVRTINVQRTPAAYLALVTGDFIRDRNPPILFV
jgi:hypothetical protein